MSDTAAMDDPESGWAMRVLIELSKDLSQLGRESLLIRQSGASRVDFERFEYQLLAQLSQLATLAAPSNLQADHLTPTRRRSYAQVYEDSAHICDRLRCWLATTQSAAR